MRVASVLPVYIFLKTTYIELHYTRTVYFCVTVQRPCGTMLRRRTAQEQRVAVPDAAKGGTADSIDNDDAIDDDGVNATNYDDRA